jgi:hypothetical protein
MLRKVTSAFLLCVCAFVAFAAAQGPASGRPSSTPEQQRDSSKIVPVKPAPLAKADVGMKIGAPIAKGNVGVTEFIMEGEVEDIQWVGSNKRSVLVLTTASNLYRSGDEGKTWRNVIDSLPALSFKGAPSGTNTVRKVKKLVVSSVDANLVFIVGQGTSHWVTKDAGRTFVAVNSVVKFHDVVMHPADKTRILASSMAAKCHDAKANGLCYKSVYATEDFGASWIKVTDYVVQFDWAHNLGSHQADSLPPTAMFATVFNKKVGNQKFGHWDKDIDFVRSDDFFKSKPTVLVPHGNRFLFTKKFLFVAQVSPLHDTEVELQMSSDGARTFLRGTLPYRIKQHSYTILDTSEDTVFLHVNHEGEGAKWGNVYISNADGLNYTLSLPHNSRESSGKCDFEKIEGLEGIYLANFIDMVGSDSDDTTDDSTMSQENSAKDKQVKRGKKPPPKMRSVITFDKGGVWSYLHAPKFDANGKPVKCDSTDCSLHLHGVTDEWGPFYSTDTSVGLIMATGNIGTSLSDNQDEINTYFSRDAGLSWFEVAKGSHIYEFGDHGGLIVMANDIKATDTIYYSWNEGMTWSPFKFSDKKLEIDNIIIEPSATSQKFMVYGSRSVSGTSDKNSNSVGAVYFLDFGELHAKRCKGVEAPGTPDSDYEKWTPSDGRLGDKCLLGHQVTYIRRKREAQCFNGEKLERRTFVKHCKCAESDFECDVGYARSLEGGPCNLLSPSSKPSSAVPDVCPSGTSYKVLNGYRRIAGDTCSGGVDRSPTELPCPRSLSHTGAIVLFIVLCLIIGLYYSGKSKTFSGAINSSNQFSQQAIRGGSTAFSICRNLLCICCRNASSGMASAGYNPVGKGALPETAAGYEAYEGYQDKEDSSEDSEFEEEEEDEDAMPMATPVHNRNTNSGSNDLLDLGDSL